VVAALLRLRFRVLANTLGRNTIQLVAVIAGGLSTLLLLLFVLVIFVRVSTEPPEAIQVTVVVGGSVVILGWLVVPLMFDGVDRTLDPLKLARFPLRTSSLMTAMFLVGVLWVPGVATVVAALATAIAWMQHPASAALALVTGVVGFATCVVGSRVTTTAVGMLLRGRGAARVGVAALVVALLAVPIAAALLRDVPPGASGFFSRISAVIESLGWSPFGAVWSIPGRVALGDPAGALGASGVAVATLAVLVLLWRLELGASLVSRGEGPARAATGGRLGLLGLLPSNPVGAIAARALIYWFRDARLTRQLILIPVLPALLLMWWLLFDLDVIAFLIGPVVATLLPLSVFAGLSYDGTAFAAVIAAGVRGLHDRLGRAIALLAIALPATVGVQVAVAVIIGRVGDLPAMVGLALGTLLVSVGVVSVSSARIVVPVARAGRNPLSAQPGAATVSVVGSYVVTGATGVLALPVTALAIAAIATGIPLLGWAALVVALVLGAGVAFGGAVIGGRVLDASGPAVLARLRLIRA
jgi:ABC-2 type transport system permease protein